MIEFEPSDRWQHIEVKPPNRDRDPDPDPGIPSWLWLLLAALFIVTAIVCSAAQGVTR